METMTSTESRKQELFEMIFNLETEIKNPDTPENIRDNARYELDDANREYVELCKTDCVASGDHFKMVTSSGGNDVCFNCGATN